MALRATRREFLQDAAAASSLAGWGSLVSLTNVPAPAAEPKLVSSVVAVSEDIEPLVRRIEETPRERILETMAAQIRAGLAYEQLLAGLLLAGVRNVEPRPSVGFKFHAVLVAQSVHLASVAAPAADRWLPLLWALDNFKVSQEQDERERGWTMPAVNEATVPNAAAARSTWIAGMDQWDETQVDSAVAALSRHARPEEIWDLFFRYGARDFRSIGHKAIDVANSHRVLGVIGWRHAEPILRSLAYALLMHEAGNPAQRDDPADRPWRRNQELLTRFPKDWDEGPRAPEATRELLGALRTGSADDAASHVVTLLQRGIGAAALWDALFLASVELLVRQPGIVALHSVTTTNAIHYAYRSTQDDSTRRLLLLQNVSFVPMFREAMRGRGDVADFAIDELQPLDVPASIEAAVQEVFDDVSRQPMRAARKTFGYLDTAHPLEPWRQRALQLIIAKGTDAHDYKFGCAVLEDAPRISPEWRNRFLAGAVFHLQGATKNDNSLIARARAALSGERT